MEHIRQFRNYLIFLLLLAGCSTSTDENTIQKEAIRTLKDPVLTRAEKYLSVPPITVTSDTCERSEGGLHDFYSEGDYWWPDPENPDGPYMRKDGLTNPENFIAHRESLMRFSEIVGTLTSAYLITNEEKFAEAALLHCNAWFIDEATKMTPNLLYSQAIKGRYTGRDIGIIDAIHFMDVAQSLKVLENTGVIEQEETFQYRAWFAALTEWLTTHPYGTGERDRKNNHATWWNTQVAAYANYLEDEEVLAFCINNFKTNLLPNQTATDGSFPEELSRTKPYSYSLFNLDAMTMFCLIASDRENNLWTYEVEGKSVAGALSYMSPYVENKSSWPLTPDVQYWDNWPVAHPAFLFGAIAFNNKNYFKNWEENKHFLEEYEIRRTVANKSPIVWLSELENK